MKCTPLAVSKRECSQQIVVELLSEASSTMTPPVNKRHSLLSELGLCKSYSLPHLLRLGGRRTLAPLIISIWSVQLVKLLEFWYYSIYLCISPSLFSLLQFLFSCSTMRHSSDPLTHPLDTRRSR